MNPSRYTKSRPPITVGTLVSIPSFVSFPPPRPSVYCPCPGDVLQAQAAAWFMENGYLVSVPVTFQLPTILGGRTR